MARPDTVVLFFDAVNSGDLDTALSLVTDDVELVTWDNEVIAGVDAVRATYESWGQPDFDHLVLERGERELTEEGDDVLLRTPVRFLWKETGELAYERDMRSRVTFKNGQIARVEYRPPE